MGPHPLLPKLEHFSVRSRVGSWVGWVRKSQKEQSPQGSAWHFDPPVWRTKCFLEKMHVAQKLAGNPCLQFIPAKRCAGEKKSVSAQAKMLAWGRQGGVRYHPVPFAVISRFSRVYDKPSSPER